MDDRIKYDELKKWLLDCCFDYCRAKLFHGRGWAEGEYEYAFAYSEFKGAFSSVIENIMLEVLTLIISGGRGIGVEYHRDVLKSLIESCDFSQEIEALTEEEWHDFKQDLHTLGYEC